MAKKKRVFNKADKANTNYFNNKVFTWDDTKLFEIVRSFI